MKRNPWKKLGSRVVYKNPWIQVREDRVIRPDGKKGIYGVIESKDSVYIVPVSSRRDVVLIGQYRYPTKVFSWEIPAGGSGGQGLLAAAKRELKEETGLIAKRWNAVGSFQVLNGYCSEWGHIFVARGLYNTNVHAQREEGITAMKVVSYQSALAMIARGDITDGLSIVALLRVAIRLGVLRAG